MPRPPSRRWCGGERRQCGTNAATLVGQPQAIYVGPYLQLHTIGILQLATADAVLTLMGQINSKIYFNYKFTFIYLNIRFYYIFFKKNKLSNYLNVNMYDFFIYGVGYYYREAIFGDKPKLSSVSSIKLHAIPRIRDGECCAPKVKPHMHALFGRGVKFWDFLREILNCHNRHLCDDDKD